MKASHLEEQQPTDNQQHLEEPSNLRYIRVDQPGSDQQTGSNPGSNQTGSNPGSNQTASNIRSDGTIASDVRPTNPSSTGGPGRFTHSPMISHRSLNSSAVSPSHRTSSAALLQDQGPVGGSFSLRSAHQYVGLKSRYMF